MESDAAAMLAGGPYTLNVNGPSSVEYNDVMIGEVWLCSGQSNMEMGIGMASDARRGNRRGQPSRHTFAVGGEPLDAASANRLWTALESLLARTVAAGGWHGFSAAGYFFGREFNRTWV